MAYTQIWNNEKFYKNLDDAQLDKDIAWIKSETESLSEKSALYAQKIEQNDLSDIDDAGLKHLGDMIAQLDQISPKLSNMYVFISSVATLDSGDQQAKKYTAIMQALSSQLSQAVTAMMVFLARVDQKVIDAIFAKDFIEPYQFSIEYSRKYSQYLLPVEQEQLLSAMGQSGLHAWGNLYNELSGSLSGSVNGEEMGLAKLFNLLSNEDRDIRKQAWQATSDAWGSRAETGAAILNGINGWRIEERNKRASDGSYHYLDEAVRDSRISRKTLDAMMGAIEKRKDVGHRALAAQQKHLKYDDMHAWDLFTPAPVKSSKTYTYEEAIDLIADCFSEFNPEMGEFVKMMAEKGWIDARVTDTRRTGAYCTGFKSPSEPRVFMTFEGTMNNVTTLAHELGHAWHHWVMRDMHHVKHRYPMTLAETASIFAENLVRDYLFNNAQSHDEKLTLSWNDADSAAAMINNIPARFDFEKAMVEARQKAYVPASELSNMMKDAWGKWYGDSLKTYDENYWMSKLHFSISGMGFYNYPYIFGYLFSLGVYAQKDVLGDRFNEVYTNLLRDTGVMTAEDCVKKHLNRDIEDEAFWLESLDMVEKMIADFESLEVQ